MGPHNGHIFEFGDFRLVPGEGLLLRNDEPVPLSIKSFATLVLLVERHGHLVQKSELLDEIWGGTFVEEAAVSRCVWNVRQALDDTAKERFIQNVPRRGYRFIFPVSVVTDGSGAFRLLDLTGVGENGNGITLRTEEQVRLQTAHAGDAEDHVQLDPALHAKVSRSRKLRRSAVYVGVGVVLLVAVSLYAALNVPYFLKVSPLPGRGTTNEEAYQLYQQAENLSSQRSPDNMANALDLLNQAVTLDPNFARAWAAKALVHRQLSGYPEADQTEEYKKSMNAVEKALAIDPDITEAHSALCLNKFLYEYDFTGAERACKRALDLDPASSVGHKAYAYLLYSRGRSDEAIAESKRAIELQPLSPEHMHTYALALYYARRYEEEEDQWKRLLTINPGHRRFYYTRLFMNQAQQEKYDKAFEYLIKKLTSEDKPDNEAIERFRSAFAASGWRGVTMERIKHPELEGFTGPFDIACLYASLDNKEKAFEYLEKAYQEHNYRFAVLQVEPQLDPLRDDPRFADLIRRVEGK